MNGGLTNRSPNAEISKTSVTTPTFASDETLTPTKFVEADKRKAAGNYIFKIKNSPKKLFKFIISYLYNLWPRVVPNINPNG